MKIVNAEIFNLAQKVARDSLMIYRRGDYAFFDWDVAMLMLKQAYGID